MHDIANNAIMHDVVFMTALVTERCDPNFYIKECFEIRPKNTYGETKATIENKN